jgi:hypothetical protein
MPLTVIFGISAAIAILEKITGHGWAHFVLHNSPGQKGVLNAFPLEHRGGGVRVRAAAEFALQFGWITTAAMPFAVVAAVRSERWSIRAVPFALVAAIYWSNTRSALAGVAVVVAIVTLFGRDRRALRFGLVALAVGGLLWAAAPSLRSPFKGAQQRGSQQIRSERLPEIVDILKRHPYGGLGLHGLDALGFPTTDATFLLLYAELGVLGLASFIALAIGLLVYSGQGLRGPPSSERLIASAAFAGLVAGLLSAAALDSFSLAGSANLFWVIAAIAVVLAERQAPRALTARWTRWRLVVAPIGVLIGLLLSATVPSHASVVTPFDSIPIEHVVTASGDEVFNGRFFRETFCGTAKAIRLPSKVQLECQDKFRTPGFGQLRVDAPTLSEARSATAMLTKTLEAHLDGVRFHAQVEETGRPTWARTAPASLGLGWLLLSLFCPIPARRDRADRLPPELETAGA